MPPGFLRLRRIGRLRTPSFFVVVFTLLWLAPSLHAGAMEHADFIGSQACSGCHAEEFAAWQKSHHHRAMELASPGTVLADFSDTTFDDGDQSARFFRQGDKFVVETEGVDGASARFPIAYTFGVAPLQQYLVELPDGRLQALTIAWDTREGKGRWFNLRPDEKNPAGSPLHWTGSAYTANSMCIECHTTAFEKNYDAGSDTYASEWEEAGVGCEACHGPGGAHDAMMRSDAEPSADYGFDYRFSQNRWLRQAGAAIALPQSAPQSELMLDVCAPCHSRRATLSEPGAPGESLFDHYRPSLLEDGLYYADGQIHDEVFVWGSFTQSRMHAAGVTCNDCHEPHGMELRAEGDALCAGCHSPQVYESAAHSFHDEADVACVDCHMPATTYMEVDPRRDHQFGLPRPDLSEQTGTPNACANCHVDMSSAELAGAIKSARGDTWQPRPSVAPDLHAARQGRRTPALARWAADNAIAPIARATLVAEIGAAASPAHRELLAAAHSDPEPLIRIAALSTLPRRLARETLRFALDSLSDDRKAVRVEAVRALLPVPAGAIDKRFRQVHAKAISEYEQTLSLNADQAQSLVALAELRASQGQLEQALDAFERSITRHPYFLPAYVNSADLRRQTGDEEGVHAVLQQGLNQFPEEPALHYALGLQRVRTRDMDGAMSALADAARLSQNAPEYAYTYAVALESQGDLAGAIGVLEKSLQSSPNAGQIVELLAMYQARQVRPQ